MEQQIISSTTRRLRNGRVEEKTVRIRTFDSNEEYERATGVSMRFREPVNLRRLFEAIDEYMENVENLEW